MISPSPAPPALLHRWLRRAVDVQPDEVRATLLGFCWFFCLLGGYYLLRPLRDALGLAGGADELQWLFSATFVAMLALVPLFGWLVTRLPPRRFVPLAYRFFTVSILVFCLLIASGVHSVWVGRVFFVWISVFNLFVISIFWSVLADCFSNAQGRRLFGFIAAGGTAGTFVGPALAATLVTARGPVALTLGAALLLEAALQCFHRLYPRDGERLAHDGAAGAATGDTRPIGGSVLAGLALIARSPYLLGLCGYLLLHTAASTFLYFEQGRIVASAFADTASRTRFFAPGTVHTIFGVAKACRGGPIKARDAARAAARARSATPSGPPRQAFPKGWRYKGPSAALPALARLQPCCARAPCIQPLVPPTRSPKMV